MNIKRQASRRQGRAKRLDKKVHQSDFYPVAVKRRIPTTEICNEVELDRLEEHADWILKEVGVEFRGDPEAIELFKEAGATVKGDRSGSIRVTPKPCVPPRQVSLSCMAGTRCIR